MRTPVAISFVALTIALALVGCAPTPHPEPTSEPPIVGPTAAPDVDPVTTLPLDCEQLVTTSQVQAAVVAPISVRIDESTPPSPINWVGLAEAGGLHCIWGGENRTDGSYDSGLAMTILPNAATDFAVWAESLPAAYGSVGVGDDSRIYCLAEGGPRCDGGLLVDGYWVDVLYSNADGASVTDGTLASTFAGLVGPVISAIQGAGAPRAAWQAPAGGLDVSAFCASPERVSAAIAVPIDELEFSPSYAVEGTYPEGVGANRSGMQACSWEAPTDESGYSGSGSIDVLATGDWVFPGYEVTPPSWTLAGSGTPVTVDGTLAYVACGDQCHALVALDGGLLGFDVDSYDLTEFTQMLERLLAAPAV